MFRYQSLKCVRAQREGLGRLDFWYLVLGISGLLIGTELTIGGALSMDAAAQRAVAVCFEIARPGMIDQRLARV